MIPFVDGDDLITKPEGWAVVTLIEAGTLQRGFDLPIQDRADGSVPIYAANGPVGTHSIARVKGPGVVTGRSGTIGKVHFVETDFWPLNTSLYVKDFHGNDPEFVALLLKTLGLERYLSGTGVPTLNRNIVHEVPVAIAPLREQKRIVAKVKSLSHCAKIARNHLSRVRSILKRFRQAVLAAACSGRLTEDWRGSHRAVESGTQLLNRISQERDGIKTSLAEDRARELFDVPESWAQADFGVITNNLDGRRIPVKSEDRAKRRGPFPYYGASGVIDTIDGFLFDGEFLLIAEDGANLLSRSTPIAFRANGKFWVNNHAHIVQALCRIPLPYLEIVLNSMDLQEFVTGSAQPKMTQQALNAIRVPIPPLEEQHEIVRRVHALFNISDAVAKRVEFARDKADKLTQSILAKAFRGELVPTEAELARREGREYEPASVLLERIKQERSKDSSAKSKRRHG